MIREGFIQTRSVNLKLQVRFVTATCFPALYVLNTLAFFDYNAVSFTYITKTYDNTATGIVATEMQALAFLLQNID